MSAPKDIKTEAKSSLINQAFKISSNWNSFNKEIMIRVDKRYNEREN